MAKNVKSLNINSTEYTMRPYGTCGTSARTAAKVVSCADFALVTGATILVKFTATNVVANATLNVNNTGAKSIRYNDSATTTATRWPAGSIVEFYYDGTYWQVLSMQLPLATSTADGLISTAAQTIAGAKTFSDNTSITGTLTVGTTSATKSTTLNGPLSVVGNIVQKGGNVILDSNDKKADGSYGATPRLVFRRGVTTDAYSDWDMWGNSEGNFFLRRGTSTTAGTENTWKNIMVAKDTEVIFSDTVKATTFVGALTGNVTGNVSGSSGSCTGNAASATKLATARTIGIGTGATGTATSFNGTANITIPITDVKEAYLSWGGKALNGSLSPVDVAMDGTWSANRLSFMPASDISVKYSTDTGSTWTDYGLTDAQKVSLVTTGLSTTIYPGKKNTTSETATTAQRQIANSDQVEVTLTATASKTYFSLKKIYIYVATQGGYPCVAKVDYAKVGNESTWINHGTYTVSGWSGWNSIPIEMSFGGSSTQTSNTRKIRIRFYSTGYQTGYGGTSGTKPINFAIQKIAMHGETSWSNSGGNLSLTGHMYSWDASKNVTFPAKVTASGGFGGNADSATKASKIVTATTSGLYYLCGVGTSAASSSGEALVKRNTVYVTASSQLYASGGFYETSDERLKTFINPINVNLETLSKLRKSYFTFNSAPDKIELGVSAQEIQELYPEIVNTDEDGILSVAYDKLSVIALGAVDELIKKNKELEERLSNIERVLAINNLY